MISVNKEFDEYVPETNEDLDKTIQMASILIDEPKQAKPEIPLVPEPQEVKEIKVKKKKEEKKPVIKEITFEEPKIKKTNNKSIFSVEYNKLNEKEKILKMNPEITRNVKKENKYAKYAILLPIIVFVSTLFMGVYVFTNNIKADGSNLIKIQEKNKTGYIDKDGNKVISSKYIYGSDFYNGYAIVKNQNDLFAIIDSKDKYVVPFGIYYYIERFNNIYVVSRYTQSGLKLALLDSNLDEITKFKYDSISYAKNNTFTFVRNNTMGILNSDGKEVYKFESNDVDDKYISIEFSKVKSENESTKYAKVKVNDSSTIINVKTGKEIYKYTLENIEVLDNNIFYVKSYDDSFNNKYFVIKNDKIIYQTFEYKRIRIDDYDSNILVCIKNDITYDYINLKNKKKINIDDGNDYIYSDGILIKKYYDYNNDVNIYKLSDGKKEYEIKNITPVKDEFKNGYMKVYVADNKYNFINKKGELLNDDKYDYASNFNSNGYAIVSKDNNYGVIDESGKEIIKLKYEKIEFVDVDLFKNMKRKYKKDFFIYYIGTKKGLLSQDGVEVKAIYNGFDYITTKYPFVKAHLAEESRLINIISNKDYNFELDDDITINDNYFIYNSKYYNYDGKVIFNLK